MGFAASFGCLPPPTDWRAKSTTSCAFTSKDASRNSSRTAGRATRPRSKRGGVSATTWPIAARRETSISSHITRDGAWTSSTPLRREAAAERARTRAHTGILTRRTRYAGAWHRRNGVDLHCARRRCASAASVSGARPARLRYASGLRYRGHGGEVGRVARWLFLLSSRSAHACREWYLLDRHALRRDRQTVRRAYSRRRLRARCSVCSAHGRRWDDCSRRTTTRRTGRSSPSLATASGSARSAAIRRLSGTPSTSRESRCSSSASRRQDVNLPMPSAFASQADLAGFGVDVWLPLQLDPSARPVNTHPYSMLARLAPGASVDDAQRELAALTARLPEIAPSAYSPAFMRQYHFSMAVTPLADRSGGRDRACALGGLRCRRARPAHGRGERRKSFSRASRSTSP